MKNYLETKMIPASFREATMEILCDALQIG